MKNILTRFSVGLSIILISVVGQARIEKILGSVPLNSNPNLNIPIPDTENSEIMISRDQYLISYNKYRRAPNWVAWKLEADQLGNSGRTNKFLQDSELEEALTQQGGNFHAVQSTDYTQSCFDRGHQIPSGDRTDTPENNAATFLMSNMIPQTPYLNQVIWEHLEAYTRDLVKTKAKKVYVIAGPIYDEEFGSIGPNKDIPVPSKNFKIVFILDANLGLANFAAQTPAITVIMPNLLKNGNKPTPYDPNCGTTVNNFSAQDKNDWKKYQVNLSDIEEASGIQFKF